MIWLVCTRCDSSKHADAWDLCDECRDADRQAVRRARQDAICRLFGAHLGLRTRFIIGGLSTLGLLAGVLSTITGTSYLEALASLAAAGVYIVVLGVLDPP